MAGRLVERQEHRQERQRRQEQGLGGWRSRWRRAEERSRPARLRLRQGPQEGGRRQLPEPKAPERNPRAPQQSPRAPPGGWPQRGGRLCTGRRRRLAEPGSSQLCRGGRSTWKPGGRRGPEHPGRVGGAHRTDEAVAKAVATLHAELCGKGAVEEALVKVTVAASRLSLGHEPAAPAGLHEAPGLVDREAPRGRVGPQEGARLARRPQEQAEDVPRPGRHGG